MKDEKSLLEEILDRKKSIKNEFKKKIKKL